MKASRKNVGPGVRSTGFSLPEQQPKARTPSAPPGLRLIALITLLGLLLVLALRLTMTEALRQTLAQKGAWLTAIATGKAGDLPPIDGPAVTAGLAAAAALLAAVAAACAAAAGALSKQRAVRFLLIVLLVALALASAFAAANRFNALVGAVDLGLSLLAGWAISVLCQSRLLGDRARRVVIMALVAILAAWAFRGLYQRFVEFPETIADYRAHKAEQLQQVGIPLNDQFQIQLFENRMLDQMVSGFISFSNVMAAGLIGLLAVLAGVLAARFIPPARAPDLHAANPDADSSEISFPALWSVLAMILVVAGILAAILTRSRGGAVLSIVVVAVIPAAAFFWRGILARRRQLIAGALVAAAVCAAAVISYGIATDSLPSKSLNFRWHYWTGAARLTQQHPLAGVGLNNFGDYYGSVKRPSSPEDVTDPHSFFIRFAAEIGIPATLLLALLLALQIRAAVRPLAPTDHYLPVSTPGWPFFIKSAALCFLWWMVHFFLAEPTFAYGLYFAFMYTFLCAGAAWVAAGLLQLLSPAGIRAVTLAGLLGALAMVAYDQINMALVTGPVATLFWVLLGLADSYDPIVSDLRSAPRNPVAYLPAGLCAAGAITLALIVWLPLLNDAMPWDPAPLERRYIQAGAAGDNAAALSFLNAAIARAPRSMELQQQRIAFKLKFHEPIAADVHRVLELDHANARPRINAAMPDSDLPREERARILEEALHLDDQLPTDESKRLSAAEKSRIRTLIQDLRKPSAP